MPRNSPSFYRFDDGPVVVPAPGEAPFGDNGREGQSFELLDVKWGSATNGTTGGTVTWSFATSNLGIEPSDFTLPMPTFFQDEVRDAFNAWEAVANIEFVEVADGVDVNIRVGMGVLDGPIAPGSGGTIGTAFYSFSGGVFLQSHIVLDVDDYTNINDSEEFFLTTLHEIGHSIGLGHENDVPAIMSSFVNNSLTGLTADDIDGAQTIYNTGFSPSPTDDFSPDGVGTNGSVAASGTVNGTIDVAGDEDWFAVTLVEGRQYQFDLAGNTLSDSFLALRDSSGAVVTFNDDFGSGLDSQISYTATASGTFYLVAAAFSTGTGTYTLTTQDFSLPTIPGITISEGSTDTSGGTSTTDTLVSGDTFNGTLSTSSDQDWVRIDLTAGTEYTFDLQGTGAGTGTLADPFLVLRDANGNFVAQDDDSGTGSDARIVYTAASSGTYFISARTFGSDGGTYALVTAPEERTEDDSTPAPSPTIPGITVSEGTTDAPASTETTIDIISGDTFEGELDVSSDRDWVSIDLTAGTEYTFDLQGTGAGTGTLADPFLVLRDANGNFVAQDDDSGTGSDARIVYTAASSGTYFISARTFGSDGGTYALVTAPEERTEDDSTPAPSPTIPGITVSEGTTDAPASTETTIDIISGDTFEGELDVSSDRDWVRIDLTAGTEYTFDLEGAGSGAGTLADPFLVLRDSAGGFVAQDDDSGVGLDSQIVFTPDSSGTYYLSARNFSGQTGTYALNTAPEERTEDDDSDTPSPTPGQTVSEGDTDAPGDTSTDEQISVGDTFEGELDVAGDRDFIAIDLTAGTQYTFDLQGADSNEGTLSDPFLVLRDANGGFLDQDDDSGTGLESQIIFTPDTSGTYFLSVRNFTGETGTYSLATRDWVSISTSSAAQASQVADAEGYVTAADAAEMLALIDAAQVGF